MGIDAPGQSQGVRLQTGLLSDNGTLFDRIISDGNLLHFSGKLAIFDASC